MSSERKAIRVARWLALFLTGGQAIPMQIGKLHGQDLSLDESVYEILETRAIIHRNYTDDLGNTVLLLIIHYHDTKVDFHAPEACLEGRGQSTTKTEKKLSVQLKKVKKYRWTWLKYCLRIMTNNSFHIIFINQEIS